MSYFEAQNFAREEFACKCGCGFDTIDYGLVALLEDIRGHFGRPVLITSGCRCEAHNRAVDGSSGSQHLRGRAADIVVKGIEPAAVAAYADHVMEGMGGVGTYSTWVHVDTRGGRARWEG